MKRKNNKPKAVPRRLPAKEMVYPKGITANGRHIYKAMKENNVKGSWKDWVLFVGNQMIERYGTYTIQRGDNVSLNLPIVLLHKSNLAKVFDKNFGEKFWNSKWGHRTNIGAPPRKQKAN